jgi:hypothetical protein
MVYLIKYTDAANQRLSGKRSAVMRSRVARIAATAASALAASCSSGQSTDPFGPYIDHAIVRGTVKDASGNPVNGATVMLTVTDNVQLGPGITSPRTETTATGAYQMAVERMGPNNAVPTPPETHQARVSVTRSGSGITSATIVLRFAPKAQPAPETVADVVFTP